MKKTGATLNRGNSKQVVQTPREFLDAVEKRFGEIGFDLAATKETSVLGPFCYFGPDHDFQDNRDSLIMDWTYLEDVKWLNPPFSNIGPWAKKCAEMQNEPDWTLFLVPYSAGSNWWANSVRRKAMIFALKPRIRFVGHKYDYPKDLALCAYGYGVHGEDVWRWK